MHLLFDLDGTLTDCRDGIVRCFRHALGELRADLPAESELTCYVGSPLAIADCFAELLQTTDSLIIERAVALYRSRFERVGMFENALYPGVEAALSALRSEGNGLHVVTAKPAVYARQILRHFGIDCFFSSLTGPELAARNVNKESLIRQSLVDNGAAPHEAVVIGDRAADIIGARQNGVRSIGVTWGYGGRQELADADHIVDSWVELVACLQRAA